MLAYIDDQTEKNTRRKDQRKWQEKLNKYTEVTQDNYLNKETSHNDAKK